MKNYEERMEAVQQKLQQKKTQRKALAITAVTLCFCLVAGIFMFPFDEGEVDIQKYNDSEYFKVIEAINRDFPNYKDNWLIQEDWADDESKDLIYEAGPPAAAPGDTATNVNNSNNSSVEITDHQVAGVLEADLIKRSQTHIFYLKNRQLQVYPIAGDETKLLNTWELPVTKSIYYYSVEMYLSADATRLNLVVSGTGKLPDMQQSGAFIQLISLNVTDPENIQQETCTYILGSLHSVRMAGSQLLVVSQYRPDGKIDFEDKATFLPGYGTSEEMEFVPADQIVVPDRLDSLSYTVVTMLDSRDLTVIDSGAFMSYTNSIYVSKDRIYATRSYSADEFLRKTEDKEIRLYKTMSDISCMTYGADGLETAGTFTVEGTVRNQYYMDEHDGIFRVVTETFRREMQLRENGTVELIQNSTRNANLSCFQVGTWEQKAVVEQFAPNGETVESVRFDGDYAYVCTAVVVTLTDPVFFFDMTDLNSITVKDTGVIEGYSSSLIQLNDGLLLGIGMDDARNLKVEVYEEMETGVQSLCVYNSEILGFAQEYKAYYIDRENNFFGIPTDQGYLLLAFDGYQLVELKRAEYTGYVNNTRGVVIDHYLYVFGDQSFDVAEI